MTDDNDTGGEVKWKMFTRTEKIIIAVLFAAICSGIAYFFLAAAKVSEKPPAPDTLASLNTKIQHIEHPLRKLVETELGTQNTNRSVKYANVQLTALDPQGQKVSVQWDEFCYKKWGGYFFAETHRGTLQTHRSGSQWTAAAFTGDADGLPIEKHSGEKMPETDNTVLVRLWNDRSGEYEMFDESVCRFDNSKPAVIIVHGMGGDSKTLWIKAMAQRIRKIEPGTNIIAIDWSPLQRRQKSSGDWIDWDWAAHLIKEQSGIDTEKYLNLMGKETFKRWMSGMVDTLNLPATTAAQIPKAVEQVDGNLFGSEGLCLEAEKTHIIGFSHGAHIAGMLGSRQNGKIRRITALDPSTRIVHLQPENYWGNAWDKNSACFVDMYASSSVLGTSKIYGHRTFFVKPKKANSWWYPDVFHPVESHLYSAKWFLSTIGGSDNRFGYAISVTQKDTEDKMTNITSTLPRAGEFDGIDEEVENE